MWKGSDIRVTLAELYIDQIYLAVLCRIYFRERTKVLGEWMSGWINLLAQGYLGKKGMRVFKKPNAYNLDAGIEEGFECK